MVIAHVHNFKCFVTESNNSQTYITDNKLAINKTFKQDELQKLHLSKLRYCFQALYIGRG